MGTERILIVDDEKNIVASLKEILTDEGYEVSVAEDGLGALEMIQSDPPDLVLLDIWLPGMDGIEVLRTVKTYHPEIEILIMSGHGTIDTAVKATKLGAYDFIEKPFSLDQLTLSVESVLKQKKTQHHYNGIDLYQKGEFPLCFELLVEVKKATLQASRDNRPVLLLGERGTGKEFIAHAIHRGSPHGGRPFIKVNCAVRKPGDILSKLFPREKTTGTEPAKPIIYLTNIEALDKSLQDRLAGALDKGMEGNFLPARLIVSSSRNLHELARAGQFSPKLLDRFRDRTVKIPPLREYGSSIPVMVKDYFQECAKKGKFPVPEIDADALTALCEYHWPKNINELRSVLDKLLITGSSRRQILFQDLPPEIQEPQGESGAREFETSESYKDVELFWEKGYIIHHLRKNDWDLEKTCQTLKVDPGPFKEKLRRQSIDLPDSRESRAGSHPPLQRTLKRSVVLCGSGLHSGINTGLILQPLPPGNGIIFGDISTGQTIPARLENVQSTEYSTCLKKGMVSVATIEHIMAVLHMYRITNLLIKIGDEAPVMDGSAKDFCALIEDGEFEEQDELYEEIVIDRTYSFGSPDQGAPFITIEPAERFTVSYHMEYPEPIGIEDYTYVFDGAEGFKKEIAPARTFGFLKDVTQLTKMGFATGGKLDNFILLGDKKVLNTKLRFQDEFVRHKILDILGDFYLLGKPLLGHIKAHKSGHTQNIGLLKKIRNRMASVA